MPIWAALMVAIVGAFAGAALRPVIDDYFDARRKRLEVNLPPNWINEIALPYSMKIEWDGQVFKQFSERAFFITNRTGRSVKGISIILESEPIGEAESSKVPYIFDVMLDAVLPNKAESYEVDGNGLSKGIKIENLEAGKSIGGRIVSTLDHRPSFRTIDDFDLKVVRKAIPLPGTQPRQRYSQWISSVAAATSLGLAVASVSALNGELEKLLRMIAEWLS